MTGEYTRDVEEIEYHNRVVNVDSPYEKVDYQRCGNKRDHSISSQNLIMIIIYQHQNT